MPADPNRVRDMFLAALELSPEQRPGYLAEACRGDADLRAEVDRLLAANADPDSILEPASPRRDAARHRPGIPDRQLPSRTSPPRVRPGLRRPPTATTESHGPTGPRTLTNPIPTPPRPRQSAAPAPAQPGSRRAKGSARSSPAGTRWSNDRRRGNGFGLPGEQTEPVKRQVALKLIKTGMDSRGVLARFDAEPRPWR